MCHLAAAGGTHLKERRFRTAITKEAIMLQWALIFFVVAIIAAVFGFGGIAGGAASIAKILFFVFLVLFLVSLVMRFVRKA